MPDPIPTNRSVRSRTKKSGFVSAAGTLFEIVKALSEEIDDLGGSDDNLRRLLSDKALLRHVAELLVAKPESNFFRLTVDYSMSLAEMVAAGGYDVPNPNITPENFPVGEGEGEVAAVIVHLGRYASDEEVLGNIEHQGLRSATMVELLAFGSQYPKYQREYPIAALGSIWDSPQGRRNVGYLWGGPGVRALGLDWLNEGWFANCRFLAVRK